MKILFISRFVPYQNNNGIGVKICNLLTCLASIGDVTCVYLSEECNDHDNNPVKNIRVDNIYIFEKKEHRSVARYLKNLLSLIFVNKKIKKNINNIIEEFSPDIIWLEFGYICNIIPFIKLNNIPVIYGSHNSQFYLDYNIWKSNNNIIYKLKMSPFIILYYLHENIFFKMADAIFCICLKDVYYYKKILNKKEVYHLPFFFDDRSICEFEEKKSDHPYICLVGSLNSYQNYEAAIFTLESIWPIIQAKNKELFLYIIGELPPDVSPEYKKLMSYSANLKNVVFQGKVPEIIPYVKGALISIAPLLLGSGVRTKIIESIACKVPVVSTTIGAEGLPFEDGETIYIADSANEFSAKVLDLVDNREKRIDMSLKAYNMYRKDLSYDVGVKKLSSLLNFYYEN